MASGKLRDLDATLADRVRWKKTCDRTRELQRQHVRTLPTEELLGILCLLRLATESFRGWNQSAGIGIFSSSTGRWPEEATSFKEALLRSGSWFLFSYVNCYAQ